MDNARCAAVGLFFAFGQLLRDPLAVRNGGIVHLHGVLQHLAPISICSSASARCRNSMSRCILALLVRCVARQLDNPGGLMMFLRRTSGLTCN
jgi:hypothetical protein